MKEISANTTKGYYIETGRRKVSPRSCPPKGELTPYKTSGRSVFHSGLHPYPHPCPIFKSDGFESVIVRHTDYIHRNLNAFQPVTSTAFVFYKVFV